VLRPREELGLISCVYSFRLRFAPLNVLVSVEDEQFRQLCLQCFLSRQGGAAYVMSEAGLTQLEAFHMLEHHGPWYGSLGGWA